jgi:hypothetical protein
VELFACCPPFLIEDAGTAGLLFLEGPIADALNNQRLRRHFFGFSLYDLGFGRDQLRLKFGRVHARQDLALGRDFDLLGFKAALALAMYGGSAFSCCRHQYQAPAPPSTRMQATTISLTGSFRFLGGFSAAGSSASGLV